MILLLSSDTKNYMHVSKGVLTVEHVPYKGDEVSNTEMAHTNASSNRK